MVIKSFSELTWVLMVHAPKAYRAFIDGALERTECWGGSSPFFYFSPNHIEHSAKVTYTDSPNIYEPNWLLPGTPPDYKGFYRNDRFVYAKPTVIINNKYISEWHNPPINYISVDDLRAILSLLVPHYTVVYIRALSTERGYWDDNQPVYPFGDYDMIRLEFPTVVCMNDLLESNPDLSYNQLQMLLHGNCEKFISIAGGNAVISSYFGGTNIIYRNGSVHSDKRVIWHTNSPMKQLSNATIIGTNNSSELKKLVQSWI